MDDKDKVTATLDMFDGIDFMEMRREVWRIFGLIEYKIDPRKFPNLAKLSEKQESDIPSLHLRDVAAFYGQNHKVHLIKEIRRRHAIDLWEAKMMADGIFKEKGWPI